MENKENEQEEPIEDVKLDINKVKSLIPSYTSEKLCEMIVADRYFGISKESAIACMEELGKRRAAGDTFAFEKYIDEKFKTLPVLNFNMPDLRTSLTQMVKANKK
jgi:hypothetical protein